MPGVSCVRVFVWMWRRGPGRVTTRDLGAGVDFALNCPPSGYGAEPGGGGGESDVSPLGLSARAVPGDGGQVTAGFIAQALSWARPPGAAGRRCHGDPGSQPE